MVTRTSRRGFYRSAAGLAAGAAGGLAGALPGLPAGAIEPIQRPAGGARFKFGVATYSYSKLLNARKMTNEDFLAECAKMGADGAEMTTYWFPKEITPEYLYQLKALAFRLGLDISGTGIRSDFALPAGPKRDQLMADVKQWVDHSEKLGAPAIRIQPGKVGEGQEPDAAHKLIVEGIEACCDYAGKHGVYLVLENHGGPTATAEGTLRILKDVKSPWFALNLDPGNFHTEDIYGDTAKVAPYSLNVHMKVVVSGPDKQKRPTDYKRLAKILTDAGYRGYISLEYEENEDPQEACPRHFKQMREAFAAG